jgi:hypothetical protein
MKVPGAAMQASGCLCNTRSGGPAICTSIKRGHDQRTDDCTQDGLLASPRRCRYPTRGAVGLAVYQAAAVDVSQKPPMKRVSSVPMTERL